MKIVRFSTPKPQAIQIQDQKISLSKLTQVHALSNIQHQQQSTFNYNNSKQSSFNHSKFIQPQQSHIKWVSDPKYTGALLTEIKSLVNPQQTLTSPKRIVRRKIFGQKSGISQQKSNLYKQNANFSKQVNEKQKENIQIPTFTQMPSMKYVPQQQTQYYSMRLNSSNEYRNMMNSKISEQRQYRSPFKTNQQNLKLDSYHYQMDSHQYPIDPHNSQTYNSNPHLTSIQKSSISQLTQYHIPRLQQKLKQHDQQLTNIKKYLKNTNQITQIKQSIQQYHQMQLLKNKQQQIQRKKLYLLEMIQSVKQKQKLHSQILQDEANLKIKHIQQQRLKRLDKIQKQNQRLYQNLKYHSHLQPQFQSNPDQDYRFQGPVAFPSKDWQVEDEVMMPMSQGFNRSYNLKSNRHKVNNSGQMQISPVLKRKMNQISSIGFSNNKTQSFSMEANTFRQIMSPLQFQGDGDRW